MKKSILIISSFLMVAFLAGSVFAWEHGKCRGMGSDVKQSAFNNLSQDQKNELTALRQKFIDETYEIRSAKFAKQQEMKMLMETSNPDRAKLDTLSLEITDLQKQTRDKRIDFQLAAKKISPALGMSRGFGQGHGNGSKRGCQGQGWRHQNN